MAGVVGFGNESSAVASVIPGVNINFGFPPVGAIESIIIAVVLVVLALALLWKLKSFIVNAVLGVAALFVLSALGVPVNVSIANVVVCAVLGLLGLGLIIILGLLGVRF
ncbi:MAG: hypothetical protein ACP5IG_03725 [Candidatus Micrarchaeia archaeon]|jgi:hypothetical protein